AALFLRHGSDSGLVIRAAFKAVRLGADTSSGRFDSYPLPPPWLALYAALSVACAHRPPVAAPRPEGHTSVRVLPAPESPSSGAGGAPDATTERITPAYASADNALPESPPAALRAGCGHGTVAVRVHIDTVGNVAAQRDVPGRPLPADECHMAFRAA